MPNRIEQKTHYKFHGFINEDRREQKTAAEILVVCVRECAFLSLSHIILFINRIEKKNIQKN